MNYPYAPRLDSRMIVDGVYDAGSGTTSFTLPVAEEIDTVVLGNEFDGAAGRTLTPLPSSTTSVVYVTGQFVSGPCMLGRKYNMSVELTRPFRRDREGRAVISDRIQMRMVQTSHSNSGDYIVRASMPNRTDRERAFSPPSDELLDELGSLRTMLNGDTKSMRLFLETQSAKPCTISAVEYTAEIAEKSGR